MREALFEKLEHRVLLSSYVVDNASDIVDGDYSSGQMALREAIILANMHPGGDSITFDPALRGSTLRLVQGELVVEGDLTITGLGASSLAIDGDRASRVFNISVGVRSAIRALAITGGEAADGRGGGIRSAGELVLSNVTVSGNHASQSGGGIYSSSSTLTLRASVVSGNSADSYGGGILSDGVLTLADSTVSGNTAGNGGGIYTSGALTLTNSTLSGNESVYAGGGIYSSSASLSLTNSTLSGNSAASGGGGIYNGVGSGSIIISTIIALNVGGDIGGDPLHAESVDNLIGDAASAGGLIHSKLGNIVGSDPRLGSLADNGGPTWTIALLADSPAIDSGSNPLALVSDQRGSGFPRTAGTGTDIGAVEYVDILYSMQSGASGTVVGTSAANDVQWSVTRNGENDLIVFEDRGGVWRAYSMTDVPGGERAIADPLIWFEDGSGRLRVAAPSESGLLVYTKLAQDGWSVRNLTRELEIDEQTPVAALTQFAALDGRVYVAGRNAFGDIVALGQAGADDSESADEWVFVNISDDLRAQGMSTPFFDEMISYRTPWNAWTLAGIDSSGDIQGVWIASGFSKWRVDNLSDITGAPPLTGQLTVTQTSWKAINLGGLDADGNVLVTWWVPSFAGHWAKNDLTSVSGGPTFVDGWVTGWVTPWGAISYAGLDRDGEVTAYWWTPLTQEWRASSLTDGVPAEFDRPASRLANHVSSAGTMNLWSSAVGGDVLRLWWGPTTEAWKLDNLTDLSERS